MNIHVTTCTLIALSFMALNGCSGESAENTSPTATPPPAQSAVPAMAQRDGTGRVILFNDYRSIGQGLTAYYGPTNGFGFDENFMAEVDYSVWALGKTPAADQRLSQKTKQLPLKPGGFSLEAAYSGPAPDTAATCVIHPTPISDGRKALVMQFWRAVPERQDKSTGAKRYDEAAPVLVGWADGEHPCADALAQLDAMRTQALRSDS